MAVALDGTSSANFVTAGTVTAIGMTVSTSATAMLVMLSFTSTNPGTTTVSWDSSTQFLTQLAISNSTAGSSNSQCSLWGLLSPHPSTGTSILIRALWANATNAVICGVSFFNTPTNTLAACFPNTSSASGVSQIPSVTVTSQSSYMAVGAFASVSTVDSVNNTQIYLQNTNACKSGGNRSSGQASVTLSASTAASAAWASVGVNVAASATTISEDMWHQPWSSRGRRISIIGAAEALGAG